MPATPPAHREQVPLTARAPGTGLFFGLALGLIWLAQLPAVLAKYGLLRGSAADYMLPAALGGFSPLVAALVCAWREDRGRGVRRLFASPRVALRWYAVALGGFVAMNLVGAAALHLLDGGTDSPWLFPPSNAQQVSALLLIPVVEEAGWRGYAQPRLQARHGPLKASLLLGCLWAAWHGTMFVLQGFVGWVFATNVLLIVAGGIVFGWLYNRTRGSVAIAMLAHAGIHLDNPTHALPGDARPVIAFTAVLCAAAIALVAFDREAWRMRATA